MVVNKKYSLPKDYNPGVNKEAYDALKIMQADAKALGLNLSLQSGYRSYSTQKSLYNNYVKKYGEKLTDTFSAKPGHSEHQTGLAFDIGSRKVNVFANSEEYKWMLDNAYIILDEAQNTTPAQMKMFLTRLGNGSKMVITGDITQIDLPSGVKSGLKEAVKILKNIKDIKHVTFSEKDVVRHKLVQDIIKAYEKNEEAKRKHDKR